MENNTKKKKSKKKLFIILGAVVVVAILVIANFSSSGRGQISVQTQKVITTDVIAKVSGSGRIEPKTKVNIVSEVNSEIIRLPVKEGDYVNRGDILIQLDTVQLKSDMESALYSTNEIEARVNGSKVILAQSREEFERQKNLFEKKLTSEQAYRDAMYANQRYEADYNAMMQQLNAARSRLEKARDNLRKTTIRSPMDGIVTLVDAEEGEIAQAQTSFTQGKTLMVVSDLSAFEVEVEIDETDIADLEMGQSAAVEIDAFPDTVFAGAVTEIGNTATLVGYGSNDQATNFKVTVSLIDLNPKIRPGMSATVDITTMEHLKAVAVPIQAVVMRRFDADSLASAQAPMSEDTGGNVAVASTGSDSAGQGMTSGPKEKIEKKGVFVVRDGVAEFVEIETGIADQQNYEIITGVSVGDEVITGSFQTLRTIKDGTDVKVNNLQENR